MRAIEEGREVTVGDGEPVTFGGGGDNVAEGGLPGDEWIAAIDWVSKPDATCPNDSRWFVSGIKAPG